MRKKAAKSKPWDAVFGSVRALHWPEFIYPPKPTAADLDAAEKELSFRFPASYRAFAEQFGLGGTLHSLPDVLPLTQPAWIKDQHWSHSVVDATRFHHSYDWEAARATAPATFLKRVVVFAMDGGYHTFAFDPLEVTNVRQRECRIYDINRSEAATPIATSFNNWLRWIDEHYRFEREEEPGDPPQFPPVFKPDSPHPDAMIYFRDSDYRRRKKQPGKRSIKVWLAFNNYAVRDLARAIRAGHPEAFPVLADALEEAGCENADLLDSCRKGDPDIDGVWVLRVLLGEG